MVNESLSDIDKLAQLVGLTTLERQNPDDSSDEGLNPWLKQQQGYRIEALNNNNIDSVDQNNWSALHCDMERASRNDQPDGICNTLQPVNLFCCNIQHDGICNAIQLVYQLMC